MRLWHEPAGRAAIERGDSEVCYPPREARRPCFQTDAIVMISGADCSRDRGRCQRQNGGGGMMAAAITTPAARSRSRSLLRFASLLGRLLLVLLLVVLRTLIAHIGLLSQAPPRFHVEFNQPAREDYSIRRKGVFDVGRYPAAYRRMLSVAVYS